MIFSNRRDGPLGLLSPDSHFCNAEVLTLSTAAITAWLKCSRKRKALIWWGEMSCTSKLRSVSYSFMRRALMTPALCNPAVVACNSFNKRLVCFTFYLQQFSRIHGNLKLLII